MIVVVWCWLYDRTVITIVNYDPKTLIVQATDVIMSAVMLSAVMLSVLA
jgi:hypothetical protein